MPTVKAAPNDPPYGIESLAIAIAGSEVTGSERFRHLGIFFRPNGGDLRLMHMGWHFGNILKNDIPDPEYCWVPCKNINPVVLDNIADWLDMIWRKNGPEFIYSILEYEENPFDDSGKLVKKDLGYGFTCSSFVLGMFEYAAQIRLVNRGSWESRQEDLAWKRAAIKYQIDETGDHIAAQEENIDIAFRYRPEEVAGSAAAYVDTPIEFDQAVKLGQCVLEGMESLEKL